MALTTGVEVGSRLRIAVLAPYRYPISEPYAGGLEAVVAQEVRGLRNRGHEVLLFAAAGSDGHEVEHEYPGELVAAGAGGGDVGYPPGGRERETAEFHRVLDVVAGLDVDLAHSHALHPAPLIRATGLGAPLVTTLHCPAFPEMDGPLAELGDRAGAVVGVSLSVLSTWSVPDSASVLHNGVDTAVWRPDPDRSSAGPRPRAVWVGRMVPEKAPHLAVSAASSAGVPLTLVGRAADADYVGSVLDPAIRESRVTVRRVGELPVAAVADEVATADVALVTPDWDEPFGLTAVEALCCGTPVVAVDRGGLGEVLRGLPGVELVAPGPGVVDGLAAAVRRHLGTGAPARRGEIAAAAAAGFSADRHLDDLEALYRRVIREAVGVAGR